MEEMAQLRHNSSSNKSAHTRNNSDASGSAAAGPQSPIIMGQQARVSSMTHNTAMGQHQQQHHPSIRQQNRAFMDRTQTEFLSIFISNNRSNNKIWCLVATIVLAVFVLTPNAQDGSEGGERLTSSSSLHARRVNVKYSKNKNEVHRDTFQGDEYYWQLPPSSQPKAILFLAHGCQHQGSDWWPPTVPACQTTTATASGTVSSAAKSHCLGLPEERAIVQLAHDLDMLTVSMSSSPSFGKCWKAKDGPRVAAVLQHVASQFLTRNNGGGRQALPTFALGASSGGYFVSSILPQAMQQVARQHASFLPLAGYVSEIAAPAAAAQNDHVDDMPLGVFITMERDVKTRTNVQAFVQAQNERNTDMYKHIQVGPHPISPMFFHERIPAINTYLSERLANALRQPRPSAEGGDDSTQMILDKTSLDLLIDPRRNRVWKDVLRPVVEADSKYDDTLEADHSALTEVMNVAWSQHEMTRDGVTDALEWLLSRYEEILQQQELKEQ